MTPRSTKPVGIFWARSAALRNAWPTMTERERTKVGEAHTYYEGLFRASKGHQPEGIAAGLHEHTDKDIRQLMTLPNADEVSCRKGCTHCCRVNVDVTVQEAQLLIYAAQEAAQAIDWEKVHLQADASTWADLDPADRACIFLSAEGACTVYEHRPMACRKYFVVSPAHECDTIAHPGHRVTNFVNMNAEIFSSAAFAAFEAGRMAAMLIRAAQENAQRTDMA